MREPQRTPKRLSVAVRIAGLALGPRRVANRRGPPQARGGAAGTASRPRLGPEPHRYGRDVRRRRLRRARRGSRRGSARAGLSREQGAAAERVAPRHDRGVRAQPETPAHRLSRSVPAALARIGSRSRRRSKRSWRCASAARFGTSASATSIAPTSRQRHRWPAAQRSRRIKCSTTSSSAASSGSCCRGAASAACP